MATYVMALMNKHNMERYADYSAAGYVSLQGIDVLDVVAAEDLTVLEGSVPATSLVLLKFKNDEDADRWYHSDAYQSAIPIRHESAETAFVVKFSA
jgi:uncharacterized protein (DUF1330 family)